MLDPKWKGRITVESEDIPWFASLLQIMGEEKGMDYFRRMRQTAPMSRQ